MIGKYQTYEQYETALKNRLNNLIELFNKIKRKEYSYPINLQMIGFGRLKINSEEEHMGRIKELCDCLHLEYPNIIIKQDNSTIIKKVN